MIDGEAKCKDCPKLKELESMNANINNRCIKMEGAMRLLQEENARLKATISKMENVDERREYAYEMDIVIRWLDKNEDFVTEPNGKMQLLKSKAMMQKIKWLDEHPRTQTTEDSSVTGIGVRMCEYCCEVPGQKDIVADEYNHIYLDGDKLRFISFEGDEDYALEAKINYCPICRRKLGGENG